MQSERMAGSRFAPWFARSSQEHAAIRWGEPRLAPVDSSALRSTASADHRASKCRRWGRGALPCIRDIRRLDDPLVCARTSSLGLVTDEATQTRCPCLQRLSFLV